MHDELEKYIRDLLSYLAQRVEVSEPLWLFLEWVPQPCLGIAQAHFVVRELELLLEQRNVRPLHHALYSMSSY